MRWLYVMLLIFCTVVIHAQRPFIITVKTDNPGFSSNTQFTIPTRSAYKYNYSVDWDNDGIPDETGITGIVRHNFGTRGTYTIRIFGDFPTIYLNDFGDSEKLISIDQWGDIKWKV